MNKVTLKVAQNEKGEYLARNANGDFYFTSSTVGVYFFPLSLKAREIARIEKRVGCTITITTIN